MTGHFEQKGGIKRRRHKRICLFILTVLLLWGGVTWVDQQDKLDAKSNELDGVDARLIQVLQDNENFQYEIFRLNEPEYIQQRARSDLHMIQEDEVLFFTPQPE